MKTGQSMWLLCPVLLMIDELLAIRAYEKNAILSA